MWRVINSNQRWCKKTIGTTWPMSTDKDGTVGPTAVQHDRMCDLMEESGAGFARTQGQWLRSHVYARAHMGLFSSLCSVVRWTVEMLTLLNAILFWRLDECVMQNSTFVWPDSVLFLISHAVYDFSYTQMRINFVPKATTRPQTLFWRCPSVSVFQMSG